MLNGWEKEGACWTSIDSPDFVQERQSRGYSGTQRPGSYGLSGLKKNGMRFMRQSSPELLRQGSATDPGLVLRGCPNIPGGGSSARTVQRVREGETGEIPMAGEQPFLHEALLVLRRQEMPGYEPPGCSQGAETDWTGIRSSLWRRSTCRSSSDAIQ